MNRVNKISDARQIGRQLCFLIENRLTKQCLNLLNPILAERTPFRLLDEIGEQIGRTSPSLVNPFLEIIAKQRTMGGWIIIASTLRASLKDNIEQAFKRCRSFVIFADVWYAADAFAERVPGFALVHQFETAISLLAGWREDENAWVRRMVGVSVHFWAKRSRGKAELASRAKIILDFLSPLYEEYHYDAIKGVGWGLKSLGRYYPYIVASWLESQIKRPCQALMLRKAITYLPENLRRQIIEKLQ